MTGHVKKRLGDYVKIQTGKLDANAQDVDGEYPFFTCSREPLRINRYAYDCECVLVAGNGDLNAKYYNGKFEAYQRTYIIQSQDRNKLHVRYLFHFMDRYVERLRQMSIGGVIKYIKLGYLTEAQIPLPPLEKQKRIAAILDKADGIRRKRQQAMTMADELITSAYLETVGGQNPNYKNWPSLSIAELVENHKNSMRTGPFGSSLKHSEFVGSGIAVLGIDNAVNNTFAWGERRYITEEKYLDLKRYTVFPDDVIITIMGTTGRSAVVPQDIPTAISTKHLATLTLDKLKALPQFISNAIHRDPKILHQIRSANRGAIMSGLNLGIVKELTINVPPISVQKQFNETLLRIRMLEEKILNGLKSDDMIFHSLSQGFFSSNSN